MYKDSKSHDTGTCRKSDDIYLRKEEEYRIGGFTENVEFEPWMSMRGRVVPRHTFSSMLSVCAIFMEEIVVVS